MPDLALGPARVRPAGGPGALELLTVGRISVDLYCGQVGADWVEAESFSKAVGGSPTNVAIAAARLGHRAAVFTKVGADPFGEVALAQLRDFGVDTRFVGVEAGGLTPLAFAVLAPPADPQLHFRRAAPVPDLQLRADEPAVAAAAEVPLLWISGGALSAEPSAGAAEQMLAARGSRRLARGSRRLARGSRRHTILDLDYRPSFWRSRDEASARIGAALEHATIAVGNREECAVAVGSDDPHEAARRLRARGAELAIVKLGGEGVLLIHDGGERLIAPAPVDVVCGLGAGDGFGGALCHGVLAGWPHERTIEFANAAGGIVASRLLCSQAMPYEHEVEQLLAGSAG